MRCWAEAFAAKKEEEGREQASVGRGGEGRGRDGGMEGKVGGREGREGREYRGGRREGGVRGVRVPAPMRLSRQNQVVPTPFCVVAESLAGGLVTQFCCCMNASKHDHR